MVLYYIHAHTHIHIYVYIYKLLLNSESRKKMSQGLESEYTSIKKKKNSINKAAINTLFSFFFCDVLSYTSTFKLHA